MKRFWICVILVVSLCLVSALALGEDAPSYYQLGDKVDDFSIALADGTEVTLYGMLAEKKVVLITFWAADCLPCRTEFPHIKAAYDAMSDEVGVLALSANPADGDESLLDYQEELGLETMPMAIDTIGLSKRFEQDGMPYFAVIDRNAIVCMQHNQAISDTDAFLRIFRTYTAEDYNEPVFLTEAPPLEMNAAAPDATTDSVASDAPKYQVIVKDEAGGPLEGVMLQICDAGTCTVLTTDAQGTATIKGEPYAYEIHVLMPPEGFEGNADVFTMPVEGGAIEIQLKRK